MNFYNMWIKLNKEIQSLNYYLKSNLTRKDEFINFDKITDKWKITTLLGKLNLSSLVIF
jgi:hypothetical protein